MTESLLPWPFWYWVTAVIPIVPCGLMYGMKDLGVVKEETCRGCCYPYHNEPILTGCYNNHRLSVLVVN
jgi:hypothetical protein